MKIKFSPYQMAIFDWVAVGRGCAIVKAVAGSGKTTTIIRALEKIPERQSVLLVAFNADIVSDMKKKLDELRKETGRFFAQVRIATFHSVGNGAVAYRLKSTLGLQKPVLNDRKVADLFGMSLYDDRIIEMYSDFCVRLVALAKGEGIGAIAPDTEDAWRRLITHHDLFLDSEDADEDVAISIARRLLRESNDQARTQGIIDFNDMLYLPLLWRLRLFPQDWVIIDEAQDTNPTRRALAKLALKPGGRLMAVGDPRQAIYGFTGASTDAMDLIHRQFNCKELPLTVSYRCGKNIIARAKKIVPYLEAFEGSPDGQVAAMPLKEAVKHLGPNDAVLCRQNAPLVSLAFTLIAHGIACKVLGREIGNGLVKLIEKRRAKGLLDLIEKLEAYRDKEVAKFTGKGEEGKAEQITDQVQCVLTIIENMDDTEKTVPGLIRKLSSMFTDETGNGVLTLSSLHKSKGREWNTVAVLSPELSPSPWARQDWQAEQEQNLIYVRDTRARLLLIDLLDSSLAKSQPQQKAA